jgi:cobalt-zinc-cadmium efflux system outer membrane protein
LTAFFIAVLALLSFMGRLEAPKSKGRQIMDQTKKIALLCLVFLPLIGCAVRRYQPAPLSPTDIAAHLERRNMQDSGLREFLQRNIGNAMSPWPMESWDLTTVTLAALYFRPELEMARARTEAAEAAVVTAGARPNPSLSIQPGVPSPYLLGLSLDFPIETAGKRGYRIERAQQLTAAARFDLANTVWKVRSQVRRAFLDSIVADRELDLLRADERLQSRRVSLLARRLTVGEIARPEVDSARVDLSNASLAIRTGEGHVSETKTALAAAIGVPVGALEGVAFTWSEVERSPGEESLSPPQVQRDAVLNRLDVRKALAEYEAAEADLRLEISKQYPDLNIGPGYTFEERNSFFTIGFATVLPIRNRNQGPIAEAEARRKEAGARFLATQAQVIAESESALASYRTALAELSEVEESLTRLYEPREQMARVSVSAGESEPLTLNDVQLQSAPAAHAKLNALTRAQIALGALEDAVQRPLQGDFVVPPSLQAPGSANGAKGDQ